MLSAQSRDWAVDLLHRFEIPTEMFPEVVSPGTNLGTLRNEVANTTGLGKINVIAPATHDNGCRRRRHPNITDGQT